MVKKKMMLVCVTGVVTMVWGMPSTDPVDRLGTKFWKDRHEEKTAAAKAGGSQVVFLGDSITHNWESNGRKGVQQWAAYFKDAPYRALNLGYSGDRTEHVIWRVQNGELDGYAAKAIVLMIGVNNIWHRGPEKETPIDTIVGVWRVIGAIREKQPQSRIILLPIFPCGETPADCRRAHNDAVNREIMKFADGKTVVWCDFTDQFLEPDGTLPAAIAPDYVHPLAYGYEVWAAAVKPVIDWALAAKAGDWYPNRYSAYLRKGAASNEKPDAMRAASCIGQKHDWDPAPNWWLERLAERRERIWRSGGEIDLVFVGDSITHNWEGARGPGSDYGGKELAAFKKSYSVLNLGYGGDGTAEILWRLSNGELDGYKAKCFMLMAGTNNGGKPEETAQGIRAILDLIAKKQPQAKTLLLPIFPSGATRQHPWRVRNEKVNALIKPYADGGRVIWCDFNEQLLNPDGTFPNGMMMPDDLHPLQPGYAIWAAAVEPHFKRICGK